VDLVWSGVVEKLSFLECKLLALTTKKMLQSLTRGAEDGGASLLKEGGSMYLITVIN
jgi:hypothetical protein